VVRSQSTLQRQLRRQKKTTFYNHKDLFIRIARNHLPVVYDVAKVNPYVKLAEFLQNFEFSGLHTRKDFKLEIYNTVNITIFLMFNLIRRNISVCYTGWTIV
jgi:hypothetical protein